MNRVRLQRAYPVSQGVAFALGRGRLPKELFDAIARRAEDADAMEATANFEKERREVMQKHGFEPD